MKTIKMFNNTSNECIKSTEGKEYWISRSVALVANLFAKVNDNLYILTEKRSMKMDSPGLQCLVCGYLDWDETGWEGITREIFEETGIEIEKLRKDVVYDNNKQPYYVKTEIDENKQNVSLNYVILYDFDKDGHYVMLESEKFNDAEIDEVKWIHVDEIFNYKWAFAHDKRINLSIDHLLEKNVLDYDPR